MKKAILAIVLLVLLATSACVSPGTPTPQPTSEAGAAKASNTVVADAKVVPARWVTLSFKTGGRVTAVNAQEGGAVKAGDVLAQIDDTDAKLAVAQAEAVLALAQAQLAQVKASPRPAQIAELEQAVKEADAAIWAASAQLGQVQTIIRPADIADAEAALAQAAYAQKVAQDAYDQAEKKTDRKETADALAVAKQDYIAAQRRLEQLKAGATKNELDAARSAISAAQAQKAMAQAQLDLLKAGATREQIAISEAGVKQAQVALDQARAQLADLRIVAPFDGVIASLNVKVGEIVSPGAPLVWLADMTTWQIETDDLTELSVVRVHEGDPVTITFDAIPDLSLTGKVTRIKAFGEDKQGDITYTVIVQPDRSDERLRWNMTAFVTIGGS